MTYRPHPSVLALIVVVALGALLWYSLRDPAPAAPPSVASSGATTAPPNATESAPAEVAPVASPRAELSPTPPTPAAPSGYEGLGASAPIEVEVHRNGAALPGARVTVHRYFASGLQTLDEALVGRDELIAQGDTAADGTFRCNAHLGTRHIVEATVEGLPPASASGVLAGDRVTLTLGNGGTIEGRVLRHDDTPVAGAKLLVHRNTSFDAAPRLETLTNANGGYTIQGITAGTYTLWLLPQADAPTVRTRNVVRENEVTRLDWKLDPSQVLQGHVRDRATKQPIAGARVSIGSRQFGSVRTDEAGFFRTIRRATPESETIVVRADGYATREHRPANVEVGVTEQTTEVELEPEAQVTGRIVDERRAPLRDVYVACVNHGRRSEVYRPVGSSLLTSRSPQTRFQGTFTAEDGTFRIGGLGSHEHYALVAARAGLGTRRIELGLLAAEPAHDLGDVVMSASGAIVGTLAGEGGPDAASFTVRLTTEWSPRDGATARPKVVEGFLFAPHLQQRDVNVKAGGRFSFDDVAAGTHRVSVVLTGEEISHVDVAVTSGQVTNVDLDSPGMVAVVARVGSEHWTGEPVWLRLSSRGRSFASVLPLEDGRWRAHVPPGTYDVELTNLDPRRFVALPKRIEIAPPSADVVLDVLRTAQITGIVVDSSGKPLANASVASRRHVGGASPRPLPGSYAQTDAAGRFAVWVPEGEFVDLRATHDDATNPLERAARGARGLSASGAASGVRAGSVDIRIVVAK